jgi:hypothetical protein
MFCSSQFLSTLFAVRAARPRKKNSAVKNYDFEKKKTAYLARAVMSAIATFRTSRARETMSVYGPEADVSCDTPGSFQNSLT